MKPRVLLSKDVLRQGLKPCEIAQQTLEMVIQRLEAETLLSPREGCRWQIQRLNEARLAEMQEKYMHPLAAIDHLYEFLADAEDTQTCKDKLLRTTKEYARGRDFTIAEGCNKVLTYDIFGEEVIRWGYYEPHCAPTATPMHPRRKVSISRVLININRSPSVGSVSHDGSTRQFSEDLSYGSDSSTASATSFPN